MDDQSRMYEAQFPAPVVVARDGRGPVLIHALAGFADAGNAVKLFGENLVDNLETELIASFDVDELFDYRGRRPVMTLSGNQLSGMDEPTLNLYAARDAEGTPFLLLTGFEPDYKWERFATAVRKLSEQFNVRRVVGLNAIPMASPHTRPLTVSVHSNQPELLKDSHTWDNELKFPGSASTMLEYRMSQHGYETVGYSVHVPHYLQQTEYPEAARTLTAAIGEGNGLILPLEEVSKAAAIVREQVDSQVVGNDEIEQVVAALERQYDSFVEARSREKSLLGEAGELPSGDELAQEFQQFLATLDDSDGDAPGPEGSESGS